MRFALSASLFLLPLASAVPFRALEARGTSDSSAVTVQGFDPNIYAQRITAMAVISMVRTIEAGLAQADPGDPNIPLFEKILNQTLISANQLDIQCDLSLVDINVGKGGDLNPTSNRTLSFASHYGATIAMGSAGLLQNSSLVFDEPTTNLLQLAQQTGKNIAAAAMAVAFPGANPFEFPSTLTQLEYSSTIGSDTFNCSDSSGQKLAIPQVGTIVGITFSKAFDLGVNGTVSYDNSFCPLPNATQCFCQIVSTEFILLSDFPNCQVSNTVPGISLWFVTTDSKFVSSNATERALQTNIFGVAEVAVVPPQLAV